MTIERSLALRLLRRSLGDLDKAVTHLKGMSAWANPVDMFGTTLGVDFSRHMFNPDTAHGGYSEPLMTACIDLREQVYQGANALRSEADVEHVVGSFQDYCDQARQAILEEAGVEG